MGPRSACDEPWLRCGRAGGLVVCCRARCSGDTIAGGHSREGHAGVSTPCGPTREGEVHSEFQDVVPDEFQAFVPNRIILVIFAIERATIYAGRGRRFDTTAGEALAEKYMVSVRLASVH